MEEAKRCNATVLLGDQDVDVTLQRLAAALSQVDSKQLTILLDKLSQVEEELGLSLPNELDIANKEEISTFVEQMKQKRSVNKLLAVIKMEVPAIYNALIGKVPALPLCVSRRNLFCVVDDIYAAIIVMLLTSMLQSS